MSRVFEAIVGLALLGSVAACGGGGGDGDSGGGRSPGTVIDSTETLSEGVYHSYTLDAGTYHASVTSSNHGVTIEWRGGSGSGCSGSGEVNAYSATCTLSMKGQLIITNPTIFYSGGSEIVTIRVTKD